VKGPDIVKEGKENKGYEKKFIQWRIEDEWR
jgi:hypothetical protein